MRMKSKLRKTAIATAAVALVAAGASLAVPGAARAAAAAPGTQVTGTLANGTVWIAEYPANWNGTLILYSHGFGPLTAADAPDPNTQAALLADGYALAGSSYDPNNSRVGARHGRQRPVRHPGRRRVHRAAVPSQARDRAGLLDGRAGQRP